MTVYAGPDYRNYKTASALLADYPQLSGKDNYYMLYPQGPSSAGVLTYCDMTTDGGGWMMVARSHPSVINYGGQNWGWRGGAIGSAKDFSQAYQLGWWSLFEGNATFTSFIFGNRSNINNNSWGSFIYKVSGFNYATFTTSDTQQSATNTVLKSDANVYSWTGYPGMQQAIGYATTGTTNNIYYLRDCCGFATQYGGLPTSFGTTYCSTGDAYYTSPGPWCGGSSTDGSGNFLNGTYTFGSYKYGGTNQYMIMVK